jgi:tRNA-intron endonuclease
VHGETRDGAVVVGGDARQRYYDARGYGRPLGGNEVALSRVEAAHLLLRGDLATVDGMGFRAFVAATADSNGADGGRPSFGVRFLVYADLRRRGFYLSPAREGWVDDPGGATFVVYPRGEGPAGDAVEYRVRAVGERTEVAAASLDGEVLAVVDEESAVSYFETERFAPSGATDAALPSGVPADLLGDRVVAWDPPADLHRATFYGQPLGERDGVEVDALQLSLLEGAYLAAREALALDAGYDGVVAAGRTVEGDRFDRRLRAYAALRERGVVPKTGYKFGADFRTYADVDDVADLGHSERLVRVVPAGHQFHPRDLALDVRLAGGVRKEMTFAVVPGDGDVEWLAVRRLTP